MRRAEGKRGPYLLFMAFITLLFIMLGVRLFHLQVVRGGYFRSLSSRNHIRVVASPAPRGIISDRNGILLADNVPAFMVSAIPSEFDSSRIELVAAELGMESSQLNQMLQSASAMPHRPIVLREGMTVEEASPSAENLFRMPGVIFDVAPLRRYHMPQEFCHLLGYVGLSDTHESYEGEVVGRAGLELALDDRLIGTPGLRREIIDAYGRIVEEFASSAVEEPVPGTGIRLTVDSRLQAIATDKLSMTGLPGSAVVVNFETGDILCAAAVPTFDPNLFARGIRLDEWNALLDDPYKPLFSRAWAATYPPASTFKMVTAAWLLSEGLIEEGFRPDPCFGSYTLGDTDFGCWSIHGRLDLVEAIARSCDIYFYRTCQLGTLDGLATFARRFGFGSTLCELLVGEKSGLVPDSDDLDRFYGEGGWGLGNLLNVSIGQGELLATPLQMAVSAGVIASRGRMPLPGILLDREPRGTVFAGPPLPDQVWAPLIEGMSETVESSRGTLHGVFAGSTLEFYGKTGTAECPGDDHAMVIGFLEVPEPVAICVVIEHGGHGGAVAGPVVRQILEGFYSSGTAGNGAE